MMKITIEPFFGRSVGTGQMVAFEQYRIRRDGISIGYVGFEPGSKILLHTRVSPADLMCIETEVKKLTDSGPAVNRPNVPKHLQTRDEEIDQDDFDS